VGAGGGLLQPEDEALGALPVCEPGWTVMLVAGGRTGTATVRGLGFGRGCPAGCSAGFSACRSAPGKSVTGGCASVGA
jgi:hypothetical protein